MKQKQRFSCRNNIKTNMLLLVIAGALSACATSKPQQNSLSKGDLPLKMAGYKFKRLEALADGKVGVAGCDVTFDLSSIGNMNTDVFSGEQTYDVTEIGLHPFMLAYANEAFRDYVLIPVFPLRLFRHKSIFIRTDRNIKTPKDLRGKTIGTAGYSSTSLVWIRGMLQDEYGVRPEEMKWITSSKDSSADMAGKISKQEQVSGKGVSITPGPAGVDESDLLASGKVDAVFHAAEPKAYIEGHPKVGRLFPDYRSVEKDYFSKTGIFPIMHAVAIRKSTLEKNPWLAKAVFDAYSESKQKAYNYMTKSAWLYDMLPWYGQELEETRAVMSDNFFSYGVPPNRKALEALFRYSYEQGLTKTHLTIEELFAPGSLEWIEK